jgi:hypothetical protein
MGLKKLELPKADCAFIGTWHIYEMSEWDEDYFNMETQAYIEIEPRACHQLSQMTAAAR